MPRRLAWLPCILAAAVSFASACDDDDPPANVEGSYTVAITNGENACALENWDEGAMTSGIPFTIADLPFAGCAAQAVPVLSALTER